MLRFVRWSLVGILTLLPLLTTGCAVGHYYGPISGRVVDKDTGAPLEGAVAVAVYNTSLVSAGGRVREFADCQEAKTDEKGYFTIPGIFVFHPKLGIGFFDGEPEIYVAKPGYAQGGTHIPMGHPRATSRRLDDRIVYELPALNSREERRRWSDWEPGEGREKLPQFMRLFRDEMVYLGFSSWQEGQR